MEARYVKVAARFFLAGDGGGRHFLDACSLCKRDITSNRHVFMYRGDAAFCCRQEQMDMDAALKAAARRHRRLLRATSSSPAMMARRPTLAAHAPVVSG